MSPEPPKSTAPRSEGSPARPSSTPLKSLVAFLILATLFSGQCGRCMGERPSKAPAAPSAAPSP